MAKVAAKTEEEQVDLLNGAIDPNTVTDENKTVDNSEGVSAEPQGQEEDAAAILQRQIDDLKKAEEIQRQRAERADAERREALLRARQREQELTQSKQEVTQSRYDAITSGIAAAQAEAEAAQRDIENAVANGDLKAQSDAYRRLARAESNLSRLEEGKTALEEQYRIAQNQPPPQQTSNDPLANSPLPEAAKNWLRAHPEYLTDNRKNAKIQSLHWDVMDEGHQQFSPGYFESLERHLGLREQPQRQQQQPQQRSGPIVSAPVSREVPTSNGTKPGQIHLTAQQREAAKIAGISEKDYGLQLQKLAQEKANGNYGGQP